jgi:hypothetical protein
MKLSARNVHGLFTVAIVLAFWGGKLISPRFPGNPLFPYIAGITLTVMAVGWYFGFYLPELARLKDLNRDEGESVVRYYLRVARYDFIHYGD